MRELREICSEDELKYFEISKSLYGKGKKETECSINLINKLNNGEIKFNDRTITLEEVLQGTLRLRDYSNFVRTMVYLCTYIGLNAARGVISSWLGFIDPYTGECVKTKVLQKYNKIK